MKKKRFVISKYSKLLSFLWLKYFARSKRFMIRICCLQWVNSDEMKTRTNLGGVNASEKKRRKRKHGKCLFPTSFPGSSPTHPSSGKQVGEGPRNEVDRLLSRI